MNAENWQPNMILDDGGDATHLMLKKYPAMFKLIKGMYQGYDIMSMAASEVFYRS